MNNVSLMDWLFWYFGSCLSGTPTGMIVNFYGETNAKHTLVNLMKTIFGSYYTPLPKTLLTNNKNTLDGRAYSSLSGKRLASIDLEDEKIKLKSSALLTLTKASFSPLLLSGNKIIVSGISSGGKLSVCYVPFIKKTSDNDYSADDLVSEAPGILGILVQYSQKYIQNEYKLPQCSEVKVVVV